MKLVLPFPVLFVFFAALTTVNSNIMQVYGQETTPEASLLSIGINNIRRLYFCALTCRSCCNGSLQPVATPTVAPTLAPPTLAPAVAPTKAPMDILEQLKILGAACKLGSRTHCLEYNALLATLPSVPPNFVPMTVVTKAPAMAPTDAPTKKCKVRRCTTATEDADTIGDGK
jgi:hypothetical protein